jgi:hypothetical protein
VFRYKGKDTAPQQVGRDLGVRAVLSGRLLQRGDTLVLRTELVDVADGSQLWGGEHTSRAASVFELQDYLSREVSEKLRLRLTTEEKARLTKRYTNDNAAYQLYLQGRYHRNKMNPEGLRIGGDYLNQAVAKDPRFALAYAGLSDVYNQMSFFNLQRPRDVMPKAKAAALKAIELIRETVGADKVSITSSFVGVHASSYPVNLIHLFTTGPHEAVLTVALKPGVRADANEAIRARLSKELPDVKVLFEAGDIVSQVLSFGSPTPVNVSVTGPSLPADYQFAEKISNELGKLNFLRDIQID